MIGSSRRVINLGIALVLSLTIAVPGTSMAQEAVSESEPVVEESLPTVEDVDCSLHPGTPASNGALWVDASGHVLCPEPISFLDFGICLEYEAVPGLGVPVTFGPGCSLNPGGPFEEQAKDGYASVPCQPYATRYRAWVWYKHPFRYEDTHGPWTWVPCIF